MINDHISHNLQNATRQHGTITKRICYNAESYSTKHIISGTPLINVVVNEYKKHSPVSGRILLPEWLTLTGGIRVRCASSSASSCIFLYTQQAMQQTNANKNRSHDPRMMLSVILTCDSKVMDSMYFRIKCTDSFLYYLGRIFYCYKLSSTTENSCDWLTDCEWQALTVIRC